ERPAADERPQVCVEAPELERRSGVPDRGFDLRAVADDSGVGQEPLDVTRPERSDALDVEPRERLPVALPLAQDRRPGEACLCALEDEELEEVSFVVRR